ncbi:MAG: hypothetical protein HUJ31_09045 [Pseudomonadales bacterium]|nr:hypothetical protein [Pseudomonadales bacterium]
MIVAEGDQGETHAAIDEVLQKHPEFAGRLKEMFLAEGDDDRKECLAIILEEYNIEEVIEFLKKRDLYG